MRLTSTKSSPSDQRVASRSAGGARLLGALGIATGILVSCPGRPALSLDEVLWEKNRAWASASTTYFDGTHCSVDTGGTCPREMGWQGNALTWSFALPADAARTPQLRFELAVDRVFLPITITISAGPAGGPHSAAGSMEVAKAGAHRLLIPSSKLMAGSRSEIAMRGSNEAGFGKPSGIRWIAAGLYRHYESPPSVSDEELLDDTQWRACRYFYEQALPSGLVLDTVGAGAASVGATGFGATAMAILAQRSGSRLRWTLAPAAARARVEKMLDAVLAIQAKQSGGAQAEWGFAGIPYHFVDAEGRRDGKSEVSTADGALLLAGLLQAGEYFGGELRTKARTVFHAADFKRFYRPTANRYSHGWTPEGGLLEADWDRPTDEAILICLLSLAQDPGDPDRLRACYGYPRVIESYRGIPVVRSYFGSLFTYTFAHFWIPFECLGEDRPQAAGMGGVPAVDWWLNSQRAAEANRLYHLDRLASFPALGSESWGASACYRADRVEYFGPNGAEPAEALPAFDGTLPPHGAIMSMFLTRTESGEALGSNTAFRALRRYYDTRFSSLWCSYGPRSSFDSGGNVSVMVVGIEKGPEALGIEGYRSGMPARALIGNPDIGAAAALVFQRAGCPPLPRLFVRGRVNEDGGVDISDAVFLLSYLFVGGPAPGCQKAADSNDDGTVDISDAVAILGHLFTGSPHPPPPFPECGLDSTEDALGCEKPPGCGAGA